MKLLFLTVLLASCAPHLCAQSEFSQENALRHLRVLAVEIGPRPMGSPAERRALEYAVQRFRDHGCDTAYIMEMPYSSRANTTSGIAVGIRRGATARMIVIGGHIDSAGPEIPGADDDGSGAATVMEMSRVLCRRPSQSTLVFCCWGGEEQGLEGSRYFVGHFAQLDSVALMLQIDMANGDGLIELDPDTHGASSPRWLTRAAIEEFYALGYSHLRYPTHFFSLNYASQQGSGSDHESFLDKGIPALDLSTDAGKPIHTPRDNFENFDPKGLKRSGDVMLRLAERFDGGVPSRATEHYWLLLVGRFPIFVPLGALWAFGALTLLLAAAAFAGVRRRRLAADDPARIRWSTIKLTLYTFVVVSCGWFSPDIIGLARGVRFPWFVSIPAFFVLAGIGCLIGVWLVLRLSSFLKISLCPYVLARRALISLALVAGLLCWMSPKLIVEPALGLFCVSLALLMRNSFFKLLFLILSPFAILRLLFSEWTPLLFRTIATRLPGDTETWFIFNGIMLAVFTLVMLPYFFSIASVVRDSAALQMLIGPARSLASLIVLAAGFAAYGGYLMTVPLTNNLWYKNVGVDQAYDMNKFSKDVFLKGGEYLTGVHVRTAAMDTTIGDHTTMLRLPVEGVFDTTWLTVNRRIDNLRSGDSVHRMVDLTLVMARRPYTVSITYSTSNGSVPDVATPWYSRVDKGGARTMQWYSFPDSVLNVPVSFTTAGSDSVKERIEVTFDRLALPMNVEREMTYVIPRTRYVQTHMY